MSDNRKEAIITALRQFIAQRPGMDPRNYGDAASYRADSRRITKDKQIAETLLGHVEASSITADDLLATDVSGRLTLRPRNDGSWAVYYTTGQYWCTEYRAAAARFLASALWTHVREHGMPRPISPAAIGYPADATVYTWGGGSKKPAFLSAGDWLRRYFREQFGRTIANRFFD